MGLRKIVINNCHGGFGLSHSGILKFAEFKGIDLQFSDTGRPGIFRYGYFIGDPANKKHFFSGEIERDDIDLIKVVEELGKEANGDCASLKIVEIPEDTGWLIEEYDGQEWVAEAHRTWS